MSSKQSINIPVTHIPSVYTPVWAYPTEFNQVFTCTQTLFWIPTRTDYNEDEYLENPNV